MSAAQRLGCWRPVTLEAPLARGFAGKASRGRSKLLCPLRDANGESSKSETTESSVNDPGSCPRVECNTTSALRTADRVTEGGPAGRASPLLRVESSSRLDSSRRDSLKNVPICSESSQSHGVKTGSLRRLWNGSWPMFCIPCKGEIALIGDRSVPGDPRKIVGEPCGCENLGSGDEGSKQDPCKATGEHSRGEGNGHGEVGATGD
mmetsp:Transcript_164/g.596  ORF Transcript_164/g.596 Transcript_164/m.596 type:complete len:206 (-) Transcript_164:405-1022(-)